MVESDTVMSPKSWLRQEPVSLIEPTFNKLPKNRRLACGLHSVETGERKNNRRMGTCPG